MGISNCRMGLALISMSWSLFRFMHVLLLLLLLLLLLVICLGGSGSLHVHVAGSSSMHHAGNETDRLALLAFKAQITGDPFGTLNSWNESIHFCQWVGVTCGRRHQRVTMLKLDHQKLAGSVSPHIGNLSFLRRLWLRNNSFSHQIPLELGRLRRLQRMSLLNNSVSGEIPANISACSNLVALELTGNRLGGKIPVELGSLSNLQGLYIAENNLVGGIPSTLGNLSSLLILFASLNSISGNIPDSLGGLTNLEYFGLTMNKLVGTIPSSIFNLSFVTIFNVAINQIQGSLPSDLGITLPNLNVFEIGLNLFTGSIPISISNATRLHRLGLAGNNFTGKVPPLEKLHDLEWLVIHGNQLHDLSFLYSLTNATILNILDLSDNNFQGVLPESINNISTNLAELYLENNKIVGSIPTGIGNFVNLQILNLSNNQFTGNILADVGKLQKVQLLFLSGNKFYGDIPWSFGNLTLLTTLGLSENNLRGSIPSSLGKCQFLVELSLDQNNLSGTIPVELISLSSLLYLNMSRNNLTGSLPVEVGILINLEQLDVSKNMFSSKIPSTLGSCVKLRLLYMERNNFWGILPSSLSSLRGIEKLDLSYNNFSGKIPDYLEGFVFLQKLDLSFNDFEGEVPKKGVFKNATTISVKGNNKLCDGILELQLNSCNSKGFRRKRFTLTLKIIISTSFGLLGLIMMFFFLYFCWFRKTPKVPSLIFLGNPFLKLSYQSLLKATDGFSPSNLIGVGSFGSVYKGILGQGEKVIAVKVLNLQRHGAFKSFVAECEALRSIKHRNLVKVLTACSSVDYHGNDFKALVYEFMVNGSLEDWLHANENEDEAHKNSRNLDLLQRLNISIDVASALDYLHNHCPEPIVHCDLKPSNVLLDNEMIAHVGDFGLARFLLETTYDSSSNQSSSIGIRGSIGYAAPEYGMGNEVSTSGDVYSYGTLLLEIFTGKRPTNKKFCDSLSIHHFVKMALPEQIESIVDPTLFQQRENGEASSCINNTQNHGNASSPRVKECLISVLNVGIACSQELPRNRQAISDIVTQLHVIRNTLLRTDGELGGRRARIVVQS